MPTISLKVIWSAFEHNAGEPAPVGAWRRAVGGAFNALSAHVLKTESELASTIPCPHPARPGACHVISDLGNGEYEATCSDIDGCGTSSVPAQDLVLWNVSTAEMIHSTCLALDVQANVTSVSFLPNAQSLGLYVPHANLRFPAYLLIPSNAVDLENSITQLLAESKSPIIVVVPTDRCISSRVHELLDQRGQCLTLSYLLVLDRKGHLVPSGDAARWRESFCGRFAEPGTTKPTVTPFLMLTGTKWSDLTIRFTNGETVEVTTPSGNRSFNYIQMGMEDRRKKAPDKQWQLLRAFSDGQGKFTWKNPRANQRQQKTKEILAKVLKDFFGMKTGPIANITGGWRTVFQVVPDVIDKSTEEFND